jgi:SAM-dependent methyltransferase
MMAMATPAERLREQYKDSSKFDARVRLHVRFSTNRYGMFRWIFDRFAMRVDACVLEIGSGTAQLWMRNADRIPPRWRIALSDFSPGMLAEVRTQVARIARPFALTVADVQALPFPDATFDAVIANHMLYHVPDIPRGIGEIRRVLVPGGACYAATLSKTNMREFNVMVQRFLGSELHNAGSRFGLENGGDLMRASFPSVELRRYPDSLVVTEAQPLMDYVNSTQMHAAAPEERKAALRSFIESELAARGSIEISKDAGMFIATA